MKLVLTRRESLSQTIESFYFKSAQPLSYIAGQYVELGLPHAELDPRGMKRWFTLSSSPTESELSITTRRGTSSFKQALFRLEPGASLASSEALGDFVLPKDTTIPLVFVVGGIGITPVRSMIKWLIDTREERSIQILYTVREMGDVVFRSLFENYRLKISVETSSLSARAILERYAPLENSLLYLSGPEPMVDTLHDTLLASGLSNSHIVRDGFPGYK